MFPKSYPVCAGGLFLAQLVGRVGGAYFAESCLVNAIPCHGLDLDFAIQLYAEAEDVLTLLLGQLFAVGVERDLLLVGVDLDFNLILGAVDEPLGADVYERFIAPPGFVDVEAVLEAVLV